MLKYSSTYIYTKKTVLPILKFNIRDEHKKIIGDYKEL